MSFVETFHTVTKGMKCWYEKGLENKTRVPYEDDLF